MSIFLFASKTKACALEGETIQNLEVVAVPLAPRLVKNLATATEMFFKEDKNAMVFEISDSTFFHSRSLGSTKSYRSARHERSKGAIIQRALAI